MNTFQHLFQNPDLLEIIQTLHQDPALDAISQDAKQAIAQLVQAAIPKQPKPLKNPTHLEVAAKYVLTDKTDKRHILRRIYDDGQYLNATDGHTAVRIKYSDTSSPLRVSYRDVKGEAAPWLGKYPDITRVIPTVGVDIWLSDGQACLVEGENGKLVLSLRYITPEGIFYFDRALVHRLLQTGFDQGIHNTKNGNNQIVCEEGNRTATIMGLKKVKEV